jgi:hypothetical protein
MTASARRSGAVRTGTINHRPRWPAAPPARMPLAGDGRLIARGASASSSAAPGRPGRRQRRANRVSAGARPAPGGRAQQSRGARPSGTEQGRNSVGATNTLNRLSAPRPHVEVELGRRSAGGVSPPAPGGGQRGAVGASVEDWGPGGGVGAQEHLAVMGAGKGAAEDAARRLRAGEARRSGSRSAAGRPTAAAPTRWWSCSS